MVSKDKLLTALQAFEVAAMAVLIARRAVKGLDV